MKIIKLLLLFTGLLIISACTKYPSTDSRLLEDLAIITQYDVKVDFNQYKTFAIDPDVIRVTSKDTTVINNQTTTAVLQEIDRKMRDRGFTPVTAPALPDVGINVVYYENTFVYSYSPYYYWGYPYYGWGWYYPYYPVYYSSYTAGMANISLVDLKNPGPNNTLYIRWNAYIRGLLTGNHSTSDVTNAVDQAFAQTPQLQTTPGN